MELHATQSVFKGLHYANGHFSGGWLTGWKNTSARIGFEIDVVKAGEYEVEINYFCPMPDAGSKIRVSAGESTAEAVVPGTAVREIALPHRGKAAVTFRNMEWFKLPVGTLKLQQGRSRLEIEALSKPGEQVMDFKSIVLTRRP